ncbi:MAG TPA: hypothetical protein VJT15_06165 [Pyrinomonadaceae bacterium]|nr:hypothetical protein [Pyrinomonadaceae bacterium]
MPVKKSNDSLALKRSWKPGETQPLNLSKNTHWNFINEQYARAGVTKKNAPQVFKALAAARTQGAAPRHKATTADTLVPLNAIVSLGFSSDGTFASAFSAIPGGTIFTSLILELVDPTNETVLGTTSVSDNNAGEYLPIDLVGALPSGNEVEAIFTISYQVSSGKPINQSVRFTVSKGAVGSPEIREPKKRTDGPDLNVALGARHQSSRYDYWYRSLDFKHPDLRLPLVGTQRYQSPISKPFDPSISLYLIAPQRGGVAMATTKSVDALRKSLKVAGNKLTWNMPWSANPLRDRSLHFGNAAWGEERVLLVFTLDVLTKKSSAPVRTVIYSDATKADGVGTIPQIHYFWR